jgi:hypothetical protein
MQRIVEVAINSRKLFDIPAVFKDERPVPRRLAAAIEVRFENSYPSCLEDRVSDRVVHIHPELDVVHTGHEGEAGDFADKHLRPVPFSTGALRLELAVGGEDSLPKHVVEAQPHVKTLGRFRQGEENLSLEPGSDADSLQHRQIVVSIELDTLQQVASHRASIDGVRQVKYVPICRIFGKGAMEVVVYGR